MIEALLCALAMICGGGLLRITDTERCKVTSADRSIVKNGDGLAFTPPPLSAATLRRRSPPPLSTTALHLRSPPPLSAASLHCLSPPPFSAAALRHRSPPPLSAAALRRL